jgi:hypothetical protein
MTTHGTAAGQNQRRFSRSRPRQPRCPDAEASDGDAARISSTHPEQGWSLLCNGIVVFDDTGELLPDGRIIAPLRDVDAMIA